MASHSPIRPPIRPPWPKKKLVFDASLGRLKAVMRKHDLRSVCEDAKCPNISECFAKKEATFIVLGDICTRRCGFCAIPTGRPAPPDPGEPERLGAAVAELGLHHVVITSVARDDLPDEGAGHFARCVDEVRKACPTTSIEVLTPDFKARPDCLDQIAATDIAIFNHNLETVPSLSRQVRPQAKYERSLEVLVEMKRRKPGLITKSGFMLGLGESDDEVLSVMRDLRENQVDIVTIGQYMQPIKDKMQVVEYSPLQRYASLKSAGEAMGFPLVLSGPYVRSSFGAGEAAKAIGILRGAGQ